MFAVNVAINLPVKNLFRQFTYAVPPELEFVDSGWRVVVPFSGQKVEGFVVERVPWPSDEALVAKLKSVEAAIGDVPWFDDEMLATARWLAQYYMCSLAEAMRLFVPGKSSIKRRAVRDEHGRLLYYVYKERLQDKTVLAYSITDTGRQAQAAGTLAKRAKAQHAALGVLLHADMPLSVGELAAKGVSATVARTLAQNGLALAVQKRVLRNSYNQMQQAGASLQLTDEQRQAVQQINQAVAERKAQAFLLQGITGSGKTEVYLRAAAHTVASGRQVLLLVPEIALTAQLVKRFQAWFGSEIAVAHSKLSQNERGDVWHRMRTGSARVLIGVRSAVFAPFEDLGLVIVDEEHEGSYKEEDHRPQYNARDVAVCRCRLTGAPLVLGSATPDLCTYYKSLQGEYTHLRLTARPNGSALPKVEVVDMRRELEERNFSVLSRKLQQELVTTAAAGEQAIVLLNRRGYSTFVMCRDCGQTLTCPHCAVAMVYHKKNEDLRCHYCGNTMPLPTECPNCHSRRIKYFGSGTQKAEEQLESLPEVRVLRMDQDSTAAKFAHADILQRFRKGEANVLIGTQMVAKGHDIPNVTLVGVLAADSTLHLPDFRASERAFSLLTQAAGRAGRGDRPGHVIFQTYDADNTILKLAMTQDYDAFAKKELHERREYFYPPFAQMLKLQVVDKDEDAGRALAQRVVHYLQSLKLQGKLADLHINGPFPSLVAKANDLYRFNVLLKAADLQEAKQALWESEFKEAKNLYFNVDPVNVV